MKAMNSFRKRMVMILVIFSIAPILILGVYAYESLSKNRVSNFEESYFVALRNDIKNWTLWTEEQRMNLSVNSKINLFNDNKKREKFDYEIITEKDERFKSLYDKAVVSNKGRYVIETEQILSGKGNDFDHGHLFLYYFDYDAEKRENYFIKSTIPMTDLINVLENDLDKNFSAYGIYVGNKLVYSKGVTKELDPEVAYFNSGGYVIVKDSDRKFMGIYDGNDTIGLHVSVYRDYSPALENLFNYRRRYLINIGLVGIFGTFAALFFGRKIHYPIHKIKEAVEEILRGNTNKRIEIIETDEFGSIYEAFNRMAELETENYNQILKSTLIVSERNKSLLEINNQLETSYEMLQEAKDNLTYTQNKYAALINNIDDLIWTMDDNFVLSYVNDVITSKLGYLPEEVLGKDLRDFISLIQEDQPLENVLEQMKYIDLSNINLYFHKKDSDEKEVMVVSTKRVFEGFELEGIQGFARSVSDDWILHHKTLKRNREMEITSEISWVLANNFNITELLEQISNKLDQLLHPDLCIIGLKTDSKRFEINQVGGAFKEEVPLIQSKINPNDLEVLLGKKQRWIREYTIEPYFNLNNYSIEKQINEVVIMPLVFDKTVIGYIAVAISKEMSDGDLNILQIISNQSSIAIDKAKLYQTLKEDYLNTIRVLVTAVEAKDTYTEGHSYRVSKFSKLIAEAISDNSDYIEDIEIAGILHDIGKIGIYDRILTKTGRLTDDEFEEIKKHPEVGNKIIKPIELSETIVEGVLHHHKRYDLTGYPTRIQIKELSLAAGIIGVADALDAITSKRSYSPAKALDFAMEEILKHNKTQFHPIAVEALLKIYRNDARAIQEIILTKADNNQDRGE